jgi:hypothetical protein
VIATTSERDLVAANSTQVPRSGHVDGARILFISYHFPPSAAVGGRRVANFARTLFSMGWEVHVLTIPDENIERIDAERLRSLSGINIHKAPVLPTFVELWMAVRTAYRRIFGRAAGGHVHLTSSSQPGHTGPESFSRRMRRYMLSLLLLPDLENGWIPTAAAMGVRTARRHKVDWIFTSSPPCSINVIGLVVKRLTGKKWVADFRDPWMTADPKTVLYPTSALSSKIESWLERKVMEHADLVLFNVERLKDAYRQRYSGVPAGKFVFIPNGIQRIEALDGSRMKYDTFTISYTGSLYVGRSPEPVFDAVSRLIRHGKIAADAIRIKLVGQCQTIGGIPTSVFINKHGLQAVVEVVGEVSYSDSLEIVRRSHLALLLAPNLLFQIPAKVYDYLGVGTKILAIAEAGATADLIRETCAGRAFESTAVDDIADFINDEVHQPSSTQNRAVGLDRFAVRKISEDLASYLQGRANSDLFAR